MLKTGQKRVSWKFHRTPSIWDSQPASCRSVLGIQRANASRRVAEPGMGLVLVVGGVMLSSPGPASTGPSGFGLGSPWSVSPAVPTKEAWRTWQGSTGVVITCTEASKPGSAGNSSCTWVSNPEHTSASSSCLFSRNNVLISSITTACEKTRPIWLQVLLLDPS